MNESYKKRDDLERMIWQNLPNELWLMIKEQYLKMMWKSFKKRIRLSLKPHLNIPTLFWSIEDYPWFYRSTSNINSENNSEYWVEPCAADDVLLFVYKKVVHYILNDDLVSLSSLFIVLEEEKVEWYTPRPVREEKYCENDDGSRVTISHYKILDCGDSVWGYLIFGQALGNINCNGIMDGDEEGMKNLGYCESPHYFDDRWDMRTQKPKEVFRKSFLPKNRAWHHFFHLYMKCIGLTRVIKLLPYLHHEETDFFKKLLVPYVLSIEGQHRTGSESEGSEDGE